jgi:uncharacterized repeat protein (TIGR01451 family)
MKLRISLIALFAFILSSQFAFGQDSITVKIRYHLFNPDGSPISLFINSLSKFYVFGNMAQLGAVNDSIHFPLSDYGLYNRGNAMGKYRQNGVVNNSIKVIRLKFPVASVGQPWNLGFISSLGTLPTDTIADFAEDPNLYTEDPYVDCMTYSYYLENQQISINPGNNGFPPYSNKVRNLIVPAQDATLDFCFSSCLTCDGASPWSNLYSYVLRNTAFVDLNNDLELSTGEPRLAQAPFVVNNSSTTITGFTGTNGNFTILADTGNYTISTQSFGQLTPSVLSQVVEVDSMSEQVFFPFQLNPDYFELEPVLLPGLMRAGFSQSSTIMINNYGNAAHNVSVTVQIDTSQTFENSSPPETSVLDNVITFLIDSIPALSNYPIHINTYTLPPPTLLPGDSVLWSVSVNAIPSEANSSNNQIQYSLPIVTSYDPNDKTMMKGATFTVARANAGEEFHYRIRFQNTGNYPASFIHVRDTLDEGLNPATLRMLRASHDYSLIINNERFLDWYFPNIELPDSASDPAGSQGEILFSIKPNLPVFNGNLIENTAFIYFDFNPAVITNTSVTKIDDPQKLELIQGESRLFIWHSESQLLRIMNPEKYRVLEIYGLDGKLQFTAKPSENIYLDSKITSNLFLLRFIDNEGRSYGKIVGR